MSLEIKADNTEEFLSELEKALRNGLTAIGMTAERHAKHNITDQKAVDTGRLRNSITYAISGEKAAISTYKTDDGSAGGEYKGDAPSDDKKAVYIGTNVEYAKFIEAGTSKMPARSFLKPAATEHRGEYEHLMKAALRDHK